MSKRNAVGVLQWASLSIEKKSTESDAIIQIIKNGEGGGQNDVDNISLLQFKKYYVRRRDKARAIIVIIKLHLHLGVVIKFNSGVSCTFVSP